jgi:4-diphosphocytidyl-2-C-methyl-D-erythritol kinase
MRAEAMAKVNLSLRVGARDSSGLHPLFSMAQSIDWRDSVALDESDDDSFAVTGLAVPADESNLAWRALEAVRSLAGSSSPAALALAKQIPVAAGLGGGSADAAASLALAGVRYRVERSRLESLAPSLGSDVSFCLTGGTARVEGHGDEITSLPFLGGYALAVVVPPFELATATVYRRWDEIGCPEGDVVEARSLPPTLRYLDLANDLTRAAVAVEADLADWMAELRWRWGRPVLMSGSGPSLFGFFGDTEEATEAAAVAGARAGRACLPVPRGWSVPSGTLP